MHSSGAGVLAWGVASVLAVGCAPARVQLRALSRVSARGSAALSYARACGPTPMHRHLHERLVQILTGCHNVFLLPPASPPSSPHDGTKKPLSPNGDGTWTDLIATPGSPHGDGAMEAPYGAAIWKPLMGAWGIWGPPYAVPIGGPPGGPSFRWPPTILCLRHPHQWC